MNQLEHDIEARIIDKLHQWLKDSFSLCEMAKIRNSAAAAMVLRALLFGFIFGAIQRGISKAEVLEVVSNNWEVLAKRDREYREAN